MFTDDIVHETTRSVGLDRAWSSMGSRNFVAAVQEGRENFIGRCG